MKLIAIIVLCLFSIKDIAQNINSKELKVWQKAVVNIETEGLLLPQYIVDSICNSKIDSNYSGKYIDSLYRHLSTLTKIGTGTAIYIKYDDRKYLITAKHVISDEILIEQKRNENKTGKNKWDTLEAIFPRISIRTPFEYYTDNKIINNTAIFINNFIHGSKPYFFISDSTGDGIGIISLQDKSFKDLDTVMQKNGYIPISIDRIGTNEQLNLLDEVYAIGFPELVSIFGRLNIAPGTVINQLTDIVTPFVVKGSVAMFDSRIQHYYVDLTITPGNSGSPIIKNGKLVGIVSGINKYQIINETPTGEEHLNNLFGIGHLVQIINITTLLQKMDEYQKDETKLILNQ